MTPPKGMENHEPREADRVRPLTEGTVVKGGRNHGPSQIGERPPAPGAITPRPLAAEQSRDARSSTAAHTPGPWHVVRYSDAVEVVADNGDLIHREDYRKIPAERGPEFIEQTVRRCIANAHVIATAPLMIEALKDTHGILTALTMPDMSQHANTIYFRAVEALLKTRTAIALASGGEQT